MRLTTRTNLAARLLMACAANDGTVLRTAEIAERCNASHNHLLQVVNMLHINGFVTATRGRNGGLRLARPMAQISMGEVFRVFEASVPFAECFDADTNTCPLVATCRLRGYIEHAVEAFYHALDGVTLADLITGNCGLIELLNMAPVGDGTCKAPAGPL
ncbi:transcriptional regulator [Loktanella sp. D2R18]|uniref:RrF2 family transcriptional regulator n=1 Tax=Rhodobacterales TaxID=204455 RepID=UPI000DE8F93B|nr:MULTISPECIES: Rrf2 family transcriptional regulator [Rhodobacterales]MDO6592148.1 Rrf2 family transcriptional regulator [Yoonia sp. 1_MG-2023]RBW45534.1 transcriptional regulator [Loktanella sp. D2R18]